MIGGRIERKREGEGKETREDCEIRETFGRRRSRWKSTLKVRIRRHGQAEE